MERVRRPSAQTTAVLFALAGEPSLWRYGYDLCQELDLKPGTLYPILMRLADRGLLETAWETDAPPGRPPRHMYRLAGEGCKMAAELKRALPAPAVETSWVPTSSGGSLMSEHHQDLSNGGPADDK